MLFGIRKKFWKRSLAWVLVIAILIQPMPVSAADVQTAEKNPETSTEKIEENKREETGQIPEDSEQNQEEQGMPEIQETDYTNLYEDGVIKIYTVSQLQAIGTNRVVTTSDDKEEEFGAGECVEEDGIPVTYSLDSNYRLMQDIRLDTKQMWTLPDGFTGSFVGENAIEESKLYDAESDTVYIYNNYQLQLLHRTMVRKNRLCPTI